MPDLVSEQKLQVMLSELVPNSASYVFRTSGKMTGVLKDKVDSLDLRDEVNDSKLICGDVLI